MKRLILASVALIVASLTMTGNAWAELGLRACIPEAPSKPILPPNTAGECTNTKTTRYKLVELGKEGKEGPPEGKTPFSTEELALIKNLQPHITYLTTGIDNKPTIQFSGVNVQIVNGLGKTTTANGEGNLVIGYDETNGKRAQTGSHNLVIGVEQTFTSYGGIVAGTRNTIRSPYASVTGGTENEAIGDFASVSGGKGNVAAGTDASVSGGIENEALGEFVSVSGGSHSTAVGPASSVGGGFTSGAVGEGSSVSGGSFNVASGQFAWVGGGQENKAEGLASAIFGGQKLKTPKPVEAIP